MKNIDLCNWIASVPLSDEPTTGSGFRTSHSRSLYRVLDTTRVYRAGRGQQCWSILHVSILGEGQLNTSAVSLSVSYLNTFGLLQILYRVYRANTISSGHSLPVQFSPPFFSPQTKATGTPQQLQTKIFPDVLLAPFLSINYAS